MAKPVAPATKTKFDELVARAGERTAAWAAEYNSGYNAKDLNVRAKQHKVEIAREVAVALGDDASLKLAADVGVNAEGGRRLGAANDKNYAPENRPAVLANNACYDTIETTLKYADYRSPSNGCAENSRF